VARRSALRDWSEYLPLRAFASVVQSFSPEQNLHTAGLVGSLYYRYCRKRSKEARCNIQKSFPDWSPSKVDRIARESMEHMFRVFMVDALITHRMINQANWPHYIDMAGTRHLVDELIQPKPCLLVTGHHGNWEMIGHALSMLRFPISAIARPLDNKLLNDWILRVREAEGLEIITKAGATKQLENMEGQGRHIGFIGDQDAGNQGIFVPFFGRLASSHKSMALLALRFNSTIMVSAAHRIDRTMRYKIVNSDVIRPDDWADVEDPIFYITARIARAMETLIRLAPNQYFWLHRRWKSRPRFEREGRPVPAAMRNKIDSLPWLNGAAVDQIIANSSPSEERPTH
jgi:KDO2-lipid IV(A) lauroyltransferase